MLNFLKLQAQKLILTVIDISRQSHHLHHQNPKDIEPYFPVFWYTKKYVEEKKDSSGVE